MKNTILATCAIVAITYALIGAWTVTILTSPNFAQTDAVETLLANKVCPDWYEAFWKGREFYCASAYPAYIPAPAPLIATNTALSSGDFTVSATTMPVPFLVIGTSTIFEVTATGTIIDRGRVIGHDAELAKVLNESFASHP